MGIPYIVYWIEMLHLCVCVYNRTFQIEIYIVSEWILWVSEWVSLSKCTPAFDPQVPSSRLIRLVRAQNLGDWPPELSTSCHLPVTIPSHCTATHTGKLQPFFFFSFLAVPLNLLLVIPCDRRTPTMCEHLSNVQTEFVSFDCLLQWQDSYAICQDTIGVGSELSLEDRYYYWTHKELFNVQTEFVSFDCVGSELSLEDRHYYWTRSHQIDDSHQGCVRGAICRLHSGTACIN